MQYLTNDPYVPYKKRNQTILILESDPGWEEAFSWWKIGKPPTDSPEWKKGCYYGKDWEE